MLFFHLTREIVEQITTVHIRKNLRNTTYNLCNVGTLCKGAFTNYVDKSLALFDHLPYCIDIFYLIKVEKSQHFWTTYPPLFVNLVCECPLRQKNPNIITVSCKQEHVFFKSTTNYFQNAYEWEI